MNHAPYHKNGHIIYHAQSPWDYIWANKLETMASQHRTSRWIDYPYNRTHTLQQHTITNEVIYKPIRFLQDGHNQTHYCVTDTQLNTVEYKPYIQPSATDNLLAIPLILFVFALFTYFFLTDKPEPRRRRRWIPSKPSIYEKRSSLFL